MEIQVMIYRGEIYGEVEKLTALRGKAVAYAARMDGEGRFELIAATGDEGDILGAYLTQGLLDLLSRLRAFTPVVLRDAGGRETGVRFTVPASFSTAVLPLVSGAFGACLSSEIRNRWLATTDPPGEGDRKASETYASEIISLLCAREKPGAQPYRFFRLTLACGTGITGVTGGEEPVRAGGRVQVGATVGGGYRFSAWREWTQQGAVASEEASFVYTMPEGDMTLWAEGELRRYTVEAFKETGVTEVSGGGEYAYGGTAYMGAVCAGGYVFRGWYNAYDFKVSGASSFALAVTRDEQLWARAQPQAPAVTVLVTHPSGVSLTHPSGVSLTAPVTHPSGVSLTVVETWGGGVYPGGTVIPVGAVAGAGYAIEGYYVSGERIGGGDVCYVHLPAAGGTVEVEVRTAERAEAALTVTAGTGITGVTGGGTYRAGMTAQLGCTAGQGYTFTGWYRGSTVVSRAPEARYALTGDVVLEALGTTAERFDLVIETGEGIRAMPAEKRAWNFPVTLHAEVEGGYAFVQWEDMTTGETWTTEEVTFWMPAATLTMRATAVARGVYGVTAVFPANEGTPVTGGLLANEGIAYAGVIGGEMHRAGTWVRLTAAVEEGYAFLGWFRGDELVVGPEAWGLVMPEEDVELEARAHPSGVLLNNEEKRGCLR